MRTACIPGLALVFFAGLGALAEAPAAVRAAVRKMDVYRAEEYSIRQGAIVSNQFNAYTMALNQKKAHGSRPPDSFLTLGAGRFGFSALVRFFKMTVNDIPLKDLAPRPEDLRPWTSGQDSGAELKLNYDGVKFILRFHMRPDSPVLWFSLMRDADSLEKARSIRIELSLIPSILLQKDGKVVWNGGYSRMAVTPTRTISQTPRPVRLTDQDTELTIQDKFHDGSTDDKGRGPCWIQLDYQAVSKACIHLGDSWTSCVRLDLKPDMERFDFALWQQKPRISNRDFARKLQGQKAAFTRRGDSP